MRQYDYSKLLGRIKERGFYPGGLCKTPGNQPLYPEFKLEQ